MSKQKYFVTVMCPVFLRAMVDVEADSKEEAEQLAIDSLAEELPPPEWRADPTLSIAIAPSIVERVVLAKEIESTGEPMALLDDTACDYALLQADHMLDRAAVLVAPWFSRISPIKFADYTKDWAGVMSELYDRSSADLQHWMERLRDECRVIDLAQARELRNLIRQKQKS